MNNFTVYTSTQLKITGGFSPVLGRHTSFDSALAAGREDIRNDDDPSKYFSIYKKGKSGCIFHSNEKILLEKRQ